MAAVSVSFRIRKNVYTGFDFQTMSTNVLGKKVKIFRGGGGGAGFPVTPVTKFISNINELVITDRIG